VANRFITAMLCLALAACNGANEGGLLSTGPRASGKITATLNGPRTPLSHNISSPTPVSGGFSINVAEANYAGYFAAAVISYTASTTEPCLVAPGPNNAQLAFTQQDAPLLPGGTRPCSLPDTEGIRISDSEAPQHSITVYVLRSP